MTAEPPPPSESSALSRRQFHRAAALAAAGGFSSFSLTGKASAEEKAKPTPDAASGLIDTNIYLSHWPFRRTVLDETPALVKKLSESGVAEAWAGSFDALLHKDILSVNQRLADECQQHGKGLLHPVGSVNPNLPGWQEALRRCVEDHGMKAIRLHPNYHGYTLADPAAKELLVQAAKREVLVQIALIMEDERTIHPLVNVPPVDPTPLLELLPAIPNLRVQLLNAFRSLRGKPIEDLAALGVAFDIATLEGMEGIANLLQKIPADRLCFGSYAPFFYFESASLKLKESALDDSQSQSVRQGAARKLIA